MRRSGKGRRFTFFGAFKSKARAEARERRHPRSFIRKRKIKGTTRFVVMRRRSR